MFQIHTSDPGRLKQIVAAGAGGILAGLFLILFNLVGPLLGLGLRHREPVFCSFRRRCRVVGDTPHISGSRKTRYNGIIQVVRRCSAHSAIRVICSDRSFAVFVSPTRIPPQEMVVAFDPASLSNHLAGK